MVGRDVTGDDAVKTKRAEVNIGVIVVETFGCLVGHGYLRSFNGRFLRHRPERSERRLNYERFYQGQSASPNKEGVPKA
ncbi:hypothetical protein, partial [Allorhodopirellula solitaria]|uniref:Uncharacterized protein n=1 Tax=Allorhodopirellula solitaria TaxID=2527987 RepID=A0A5C5XW88_9BACT